MATFPNPVNLNLPETPQGLSEPEYTKVLEIYNAIQQLRRAFETTDISGTGEGGAPIDATYVTLSLNDILTNERVLTAGTGITITDNGANNTVVIASTVEGSSGLPGPIPHILEFLIGDGVSVILTGAYPTSVISAPRKGTITGWTILACDGTPPTNGTITIDVYKDVYANYPPTIADSICGTGTKPSIVSAGNKNTSTVLTGWATTALSIGDTLIVNVTAVSLFKCVKLILSYEYSGN